MPNAIYNLKTFADGLSRIVQSSQATKAVRACLLRTRDREHAMNVLKEVIASSNRPLFHFTVADRRRYNSANLRWDVVGGDSPDAMSLLRHAQELKGGGLVVLEDSAGFLRDDGGDRRMRMLLSQMLSAETASDGLVLVFLEPPESERYLPSILADQFVRLDVPYPRSDELEAIAREEVAVAAHRTGAKIDVETIRREGARLAPGLVGLTRSAARDALRDALAPNSLDFEGAFERLQSRKAEQLRRELAMNVLDTNEVELPIGLDYLTQFLKVNREKMRTSGAGRARGILLVGPPGTGKTMLARAIGHLVHLPVVEFRISSLMNSLLGETERRFAQAFSTLEAMSPNIVFIDEIEKAFGESSERDGGTMMRCTGALLSWLSDNPYPNFVVGTCNSLTRMGEIGLTMTRSERFDASFFVDVPSADSRRLMLERWLTGKIEEVACTAQPLVEVTEKFSGADLRSVVKQAVARAEYEQVPLDLELLKSEAERKRMRAIALHDEFQGLRRWGRMYCDPAGPADV
ncbi:MAG: ATP-binding protein [Thaumarchaeota archaeon]|nr:ATP-binding protein [Nitrososphaerota archaeon]